MPHASGTDVREAEDHKNDGTANDRVELWKAGIKMRKANPGRALGLKLSRPEATPLPH